MQRVPLGIILLAGWLGTVAVAAVSVTFAQAPAPASSPPPFEFALGFKALANMIPEVVGVPVEEERPVATGGSRQLTTRGLMVWRAADNWTGFTDGSRTWINGLFGLSVRDNGTRFVWESHPPATFDDPFGYCAAVGTADIPDSRYTGPSISQVDLRGLVTAFAGANAEAFQPNNTFFRCFEAKVLACTVGANLNCGKALIRTEPSPGMAQYCQVNPTSPFIPLYIVGHEGIFEWQCQGGMAVIAKQTLNLDARGFVAEFWRQLSPQRPKG